LLAGVVPWVAFLRRDTGTGSLLGRRCCVEDVDTYECSERILSRLDVRLIVDFAGVCMKVEIGIRDCFVSESPIWFGKLKLYF
jgi:hypothetical protein